ncbi:unannotated protein [freshwater metagenome]|uniref:Unannotated protein n=1 Tax=freshwater metagenome TaxID=449393 RepID=A0A6J5YGL6_9ZZZZ
MLAVVSANSVVSVVPVVIGSGGRVGEFAIESEADRADEGPGALRVAVAGCFEQQPREGRLAMVTSRHEFGNCGLVIPIGIEVRPLGDEPPSDL